MPESVGGVRWLNAFTVDVEDYFHVSAFEPFIARSEWNDFQCRVVSNTYRLLEILDAFSVKATFFVLGWVAERYPKVVHDIHAAGHEIGSHSYWHRLVYSMSAEEFREDLRRSCSVLSEIIGKPIRVYRAPSFSIVRRSLWALDVLVDEGIWLDSSVFPICHDRYGMAQGCMEIHRLQCGSGQLVEYPLPAVDCFGIRVPVGGGGYFRLYPVWLTKRLLRAINFGRRRPFVFYVHPWEIDPDQPRLPYGSAVRRWRHYVNLQYTESKLRRLLSVFRFGTITESAQQFLRYGGRSGGNASSSGNPER
ncbi:MAG: polysaccharide deacetylase [Pirellulaceae bacterium]|nr:MAG: polysaccharide deacetylase [Pirellulaceae bacterium]